MTHARSRNGLPITHPDAEPPEDYFTEPAEHLVEQLPFPTAALPEPVRGFVVSGAAAICCDASYLALPMLTVLAAAIGSTRRLQLKRGWSAPAIIWGAIVGESGTAKSPAYKLVMRPVRKRQARALQHHAESMRQHEADVARYEKAMAEWRRDRESGDDPPEKPEPPQADRCIVSDVTVEALAPILLANTRGLLLDRDELAGWICSFDRYAGGKGADSANWLSMFNGESLVVDRKSGVQRTIYVPHAYVSICGGIQPGILNRALGIEHRENGLLARMLLTCPPRKPKRWTEADVDPLAEAEIARILDRLFELQPAEDEDGQARPQLVSLATDAKAVWKAYYNLHADELVAMDGELASAWSKLEEYPARFALVVHLARWAAGDPDLKDANTADLASMKAGIELAQWFKAEARRVYGLLAESDEQRDQRRLVQWIERHTGSATPRDVQMGCRWLREAGLAEAGLDALAKAGCGYWEDLPASSKGGRPSRIFRLSTTSTSTKPHKTRDSEGFVDVDTVDNGKPHRRNGKLNT